MNSELSTRALLAWLLPPPPGSPGPSTSHTAPRPGPPGCPQTRQFLRGSRCLRLKLFTPVIRPARPGPAVGNIPQPYGWLSHPLILFCYHLMYFLTHWMIYTVTVSPPPEGELCEGRYASACLSASFPVSQGWPAHSRGLRSTGVCRASAQCLELGLLNQAHLKSPDAGKD